MEVKTNSSKDKKVLLILSIIAFILAIVFIFEGLNEINFSYNISKRIPKVLAIIISATAIGISSVIFQTVTENRILTPSILGLDSLYGLFQTFSVFVFGTSSIVMTNKNINFFIVLSLMILNSLILHRFMFKKRINIYLMLLVGTVLGTFFKSLSTFLSVLIDPNDFQSLQGKLFASFNNINVNILFISSVIIFILALNIFEKTNLYDVVLLGRDNSINLGINYEKTAKTTLIYVSILVSVSTALVGPITFLGILVSNLSYNLMKSFRHKYTMVCAVLLGIIALLFGQLIVERILNYTNTVSTIINFVGGLYFIYIIIKENKK
ncbi:MAG: iron chelate uptake ABC transporter family permease subunit [Clostridium sp.]|uniref:iron chelate uptake ABC transporter family permease subunit n=1 Tax=Clostridium TaxID=1485 RepID=UPI0021529A7B|nr:iron chelate uptake ABC transporter family permease subunit [Clostridium sp. LY3-2]MCR6514143.1 iron chelate uptake ABC transporter family permease subunit [Clostridium sp. LY3-2]